MSDTVLRRELEPTSVTENEHLRQQAVPPTRFLFTGAAPAGLRSKARLTWQVLWGLVLGSCLLDLPTVSTRVQDAVVTVVSQINSTRDTVKLAKPFTEKDNWKYEIKHIDMTKQLL
ncbi:hypothetical protein P7K49_036502 [Saguinus oedipus]|uniref:Uncharacterized protein n=1 Tax=Saguinus oedipus TaxID=9490 RepID=A0ABQ9TKB2_SAGOE|nr:hypothetical protein P7K49_036502 [Saguinus oedipus]